MNCLQSVALMMVAMVVSASASGYGRGGGVGGWARGGGAGGFRGGNIFEMMYKLYCLVER
jgi:hypothetical protein